MGTAPTPSPMRPGVAMPTTSAQTPVQQTQQPLGSSQPIVQAQGPAATAARMGMGMGIPTLPGGAGGVGVSMGVGMSVNVGGQPQIATRTPATTPLIPAYVYLFLICIFVYFIILTLPCSLAKPGQQTAPQATATPSAYILCCTLFINYA